METVWLDGHYMEKHANFFVNPTDAQGLKDLATNLHTLGQNLILTLYGGLSNDEPNTYTTLAKGALIMNGAEEFDAETYSKKTVFLDWFNSNSSIAWE